MSSLLLSVGTGIVALGVIGVSGAALSAVQTPPPVSVRFAAVVGTEPLRCGAAYPDIGIGKSTIRFVDFRFYVSEVRLITAAGGDVPLELTEDGLWQHENAALLDFEDGTADCANGTAQTRSVVEGTAPAGDYTGIRFTLGLPAALNHRDPVAQASPFNLSRLFWSWNAGYKFARLDLKSTANPQGWLIHLGSTGCLPTGRATEPATSCAHANRPAISLTGINPREDVITLDVAKLLASSNVDENQEGTARGCMSGQTDADCAGLFKALGLAFGETAAIEQQVFRAERASSHAAVRQ